ncbi:MAG: amidohydrolase [Oscillospiraceae bacterium]|jgi:metal-dependent amidase/aminoacylase/carboxypeptidase family protein|nr:amidohydrolase [Oscillospiraceae bacterium]
MGNIIPATLAAQWEERVIAARRRLHQHPEVSSREFETAQYLFDRLSACGNLTVTRPCPTGVVAVLRGDKPGRVYRARAGIDALPVRRQTTPPTGP